jgi:hypothetical protein
LDLEASKISTANGDEGGSGFTAAVAHCAAALRNEQIRPDLDLFSENTTFFADFLIDSVID